MSASDGVDIPAAQVGSDGVRDALVRRDHAALVSAAHRLKGLITNFPDRAALRAAEDLEATARGA